MISDDFGNRKGSNEVNMRNTFGAALVAIAFLTSSVMTGQNLSITNYVFDDVTSIDEHDYHYMTSSADLVNNGPALSYVKATLTSQVPNIVVLQGLDKLYRSNVPANGRATSTNTFTIKIEPGVYFSFS